MDLEERTEAEPVRGMFDVGRYEGYRFCRAGRWYYIKDGKFIRPGTGKPDVTIDFVAALTREDLEEFETCDADGLNDNKIAQLSDDFLENPCRTAPFFIINRRREPAEGLYLIIGYRHEGGKYTDRYISRKIEKMEKPSSQ